MDYSTLKMGGKMLNDGILERSKKKFIDYCSSRGISIIWLTFQQQQQYLFVLKILKSWYSDFPLKIV
jgi:hypothetical protein